MSNARRSGTAPHEFEMRAGANVGYEFRPKAGDAFAACMADAAIDEPVRVGFEQAASERLRGLIRIGIVNGAVHRSNIMKIGVEIGEIETHLDPCLEKS